MNDWVEAFTIFAKYLGDKGEVAAEHDIINAGPDPAIVSAEDVKRLEELGWHVDEDYNCFYKYT